MTTRATKLRDAPRRGAAGIIDEAVRRAPRRSTPVEVSLGKGVSPVAEDEVLVVVIGRKRALVSRTHVHGRPIDLREVRLRLAGAEAAVERIGASPPAAEAPSLTAAEVALLEEAGFVENSSNAVTAFDRSRIDFEIMLRDSLSLEAAAAALGVGQSRLRQRLSSAERSLYGMKDGRGWRIPRFQFANKRSLVRGIEKVLPHVRRDAHPLAVKSWFTTPHQDLVVGEDERPVSPISWLASGRSAEEVVRLATEV